VLKALFFIVPYDGRFCKRLGGFFRKKKLGLCPKPHLRSFFEKKPLKNPQKALYIFHQILSKKVILTQSVFCDIITAVHPYPQSTIYGGGGFP
jgi:hypothetical protein